jgi:glycosyltransferase involved in cell wall biosynthesis
MKILHVIGTFGMGGAEMWLLELLRYWHAKGADVPQFDFIATSGQRGSFDEEVKRLGSEVFYLPFGRSNLLPFGAEFRRILRAGNYCALHDHQAWVCGWHFLLGAGVLPPVRIAHAHNAAQELGNLDPLRRGLARIGMLLIRRLATHIVATSSKLLAEYGFTSPGFSATPKFPLYCGFDPARFCGDRGAAKALLCREFAWPNDSAIILVAGRLDEFVDDGNPKNLKNTRMALSIGIQCAKRDTRIRVLFAGEPGPIASAYQQSVNDAGLSDRIIFAGIRRDIAKLMLASDVLLFPSRMEGLGMVAVEAQAAGLPVLASDAVPKECAVVTELVRFRALDAPIDVWADDVFALMSQQRDVAGANKCIANSPFAIAVSAQALRDVYRDAPGNSSRS